MLRRSRACLGVGGVMGGVHGGRRNGVLYPVLLVGWCVLCWLLCSVPIKVCRVVGEPRLSECRSPSIVFIGF